MLFHVRRCPTSVRCTSVGRYVPGSSKLRTSCLLRNTAVAPASALAYFVRSLAVAVRNLRLLRPAHRSPGLRIIKKLFPFVDDFTFPCAVVENHPSADITALRIATTDAVTSINDAGFISKNINLDIIRKVD